MKKLITLLLALALLLGLSLPALGANGLGFYPDIPEGAWYQPAARTLYELGVFPGGSSFGPARVVTRLEFVRYLYRLNLAIGGKAGPTSGPSYFTDIPSDGSEDFQAVTWAKNMGVSDGISNDRFDPDGLLTREQCCTLLCRFAYRENIPVVKRAEPALFRDSFRVSPFARTSVMACQMAGLVTGYTDGTVAPGSHVVRSEAAALLFRVYNAYLAQASGEQVALIGNAYGSYYAKYDHVFGQPIPENDPVDKSWFDDAVFIGDSVTVRLEMYCSSTKALGKATFLCTTSLSAPNALGAVTQKSLHPTYNGVKQKVEASVAACGAKNVFIMLGINNMRSSLDKSTASLVELIGKIKEKSPNVNIFIQSVTPMTATSNILADNINNWKIDQYNERVKALCAQNKWYYLDVASRFKNSAGDLDPAYCSDPRSMGIHFTSSAAKLWCEYLYSHVPEALKSLALPTSPAGRVEEPPAPEEKPPAEPEDSPLSLACRAMLDLSGASDPLLLDKAALCGLYSLEEDWIADCAGFILMSGVFPDEIILVKAVDQAAAEQAALALQDKLDNVLEQARLYDEESYAFAQQCRVVSDGLFVRLILSPRQEEYAAVYEGIIPQAQRAG